MASLQRPQSRIRASELVGRAWLNTGGEELSLESLRGRVLILDFWSFCCINCLHVLDELRPLEAQFHDVLVTVGVHSPKFDHEADPEALAAAVERYDIQHPVLDDPQLTTWQAYTARAWPTLVVVDPEGYIAAHLSGEGHVAGLTSLVEELVAEHEAKGTLHRGNGPYVPPEPVARDLRFPGKAIALGARGTEPGTFLVADTGHHRLVELGADLATVVRTVGGVGAEAAGSDHDGGAGPAATPGTRGLADGGPREALFNEPQGLALLPEDVAAAVGYDVVVADSVNHRLRGVRLADGTVTTVAGNGVQRLIDPERARAAADPDAEETVSLEPFGTDPLQTSLSSPWDVLWSTAEDTLVVAMAGTHQLFSFDPRTGDLAVYAGTGLEGLEDGDPTVAWFAQSSGLAESADGTLWVADSESSALRRVTPAGRDAAEGALSRRVESAVGTGLFDFGFRDGAAGQARFQHPLGVAALPDGSVLVADTYNGAIRRYAPAGVAADGRETEAGVSTVARGLKEPSDVLFIPAGPEGGAASIVVVETNAHQLVRLSVPEEYLQVDEGALQTHRPRTAVAAGELELTVAFEAPTGQKLDDRWGDPTQLKISSSPEELLLAGEGTSTGLARTLRINPDVAEGVLHITARAASCDGEKGQPIPDHAACHLYQQDWGIPVTVHAGAPEDPQVVPETRLDLDLRGIH
ncbi:redoxin domain-containing protein [Citricoccus sp. SGAir0253]|uniref:NHL domain-containing thioredoxin family protein n=1 Tax=Citricoccus sp. SGAir0253 TaxID=2567881 RepID=UPI0010CD55FA|nr:NHL domain-containing thioredoxin family protein [Citricoccus sp. SGAir0253]QCU77264.1 redoxin domain-containing protein [Citricoccus sp. SGAir0253]